MTTVLWEGPVSTEVPPAAPAVSDQGDEIIAFGPFRLDRGSGLLYRGGVEVSVPYKAIEVLECLLEHPGRTVSKKELFERVWRGATDKNHALFEAVRVLRKALHDDRHRPVYIRTFYGRGYIFIAPVQTQRRPAGGIGADTGKWASLERGPSLWILVGFILGGIVVGALWWWSRH